MSNILIGIFMSADYLNRLKYSFLKMKKEAIELIEFETMNFEDKMEEFKDK